VLNYPYRGVLTVTRGFLMARQGARRQIDEKARMGNKSRVIDIEEAQRQRRERRVAATKGRTRPTMAPEPVAEAVSAGWTAGKRLIYAVAVLVVLALVVISGIRILDLKAEAVTAERALEVTMEEKARLEKELTMLNDPAYIEAQAREQLRMTKKDETLYVFEDSEEDNSQ
jgi:cell division protein FtsB